jgi:uncharacterized protein YndB with AHSA1/START domain
MKEAKIIGKTKSVGFEIGVRKTFPVSLENAWNFFFSTEGLETWLGKTEGGHLEVDEPYNTREGIQGKVRILKPLSHIRMSWKKKGWNNSSTLQVRLIKAKDKTTISFHQDNLADNNQRNEMKEYWDNVITKLSKIFTNE